MNSKTWIPLLAALALSCSPKDSTHDVTTTDDGGDTDTIPTPDNTVPLPAPYNAFAWTSAVVESANPSTRAADEGKMLRGSDGTLYYAYFRATGTSVNGCDIAKFSSSDPAPSNNYDLKVAVLAPGAAAWTIEKLPLEQVDAQIPYITNRYGIEGAMDGQGRPVFVFAGGPPSTFNCGSSDLIMATRTGPAAWTLVDQVQDSNACCAYPDPCVDPACTQGDVVGPWAAAALDSDGQLAIAYMDYHFNTDHDGGTHRGLEMWKQSGVTGIRPWSNKGTYSQLALVPARAGATFSGLIAAYTTAQATGLFVARHVGTAGLLADWEEKQLRSGETVGERLSLAVAADGTIGLAFNRATSGANQPAGDLVYCYSIDNGDNWSVPCETVDQANTVGQYPSLAFDKESRAVTSYYYCGAAGNCTATSDGVRFAVRTGTGSWVQRNVYVDAANVSGVYTQLVIDPDTDALTIGFQDVTRGFAMAAHAQ